MQEKFILSNLCFSVKSFENAHGNAHNKSPLGTVTIVKQLCCTGQNHIEKLSTTVTIVKQLGCTGKENVKTAGSHENAHL